MDALLAKFDVLLDLEAAVRREKALAEAGIDGDTRARARKHWQELRDELWRRFDALSPAEMGDYGYYRKKARA